VGEECLYGMYVAHSIHCVFTGPVGGSMYSGHVGVYTLREA